MSKRMSLPFKGSFPHTQGFGANPSFYARFGWQGHAGDDWQMPEGTPLYAPFSGQIKEHGDNPNGWGKYLKVWDSSQNLLCIIAHCSSLEVITGAHVSAGQEIARSGNTGISTGAHVHVGVADTDSSGNLTNLSNGFGGYYSILDSGKIELIPLPGSGSPAPVAEPNPSIEGQPVNWLEVYQKYYAGWDENGARADFTNTYGSDLSRLLVARGINPAAVVTTPPLPTDYLGIPGKLELDTQAARNLYGQNKPGVYVRNINRGWWFYTTISIPNFDSLNILELPRNENTQYASLGGYIAIPCDGHDYAGPKTGTVQPNGQFYSAGGNNNSLQVTPPPPPTVAPVVNLPPPVIPAPPPPTTTPPPPSGEGGTDFTEIKTILNAISGKIDQVLAKIEAPATTPGPTVPPAEEATGGIFINSNPLRAAIYIDGRFQFDYTPSNFTYQIKPGEHEVKLTKHGYKTYTEIVTIEANKNLNLEVTLQPEA